MQDELGPDEIIEILDHKRYTWKSKPGSVKLARPHLDKKGTMHKSGCSAMNGKYSIAYLYLTKKAANSHRKNK